VTPYAQYFKKGDLSPSLVCIPYHIEHQGAEDTYGENTEKSVKDLLDI
jgi:hypothetical protein